MNTEHTAGWSYDQIFIRWRWRRPPSPARSAAARASSSGAPRSIVLSYAPYSRTQPSRNSPHNKRTRLLDRGKLAGTGFFIGRADLGHILALAAPNHLEDGPARYAKALYRCNVERPAGEGPVSQWLCTMRLEISAPVLGSLDGNRQSFSGERRRKFQTHRTQVRTDYRAQLYTTVHNVV